LTLRKAPNGRRTQGATLRIPPKGRRTQGPTLQTRFPFLLFVAHKVRRYDPRVPIV